MDNIVEIKTGKILFTKQLRFESGYVGGFLGFTPNGRYVYNTGWAVLHSEEERDQEPPYHFEEGALVTLDGKRILYDDAGGIPVLNNKLLVSPSEVFALSEDGSTHALIGRRAGNTSQIFRVIAFAQDGAHFVADYSDRKPFVGTWTINGIGNKVYIKNNTTDLVTFSDDSTKLAYLNKTDTTTFSLGMLDVDGKPMWERVIPDAYAYTLNGDLCMADRLDSYASMKNPWKKQTFRFVKNNIIVHLPLATYIYDAKGSLVARIPVQFCSDSSYHSAPRFSPIYLKRDSYFIRLDIRNESGKTFLAVNQGDLKNFSIKEKTKP
ncbi:MAG: hypothetical protein HY401_01600 [Elusimicrobia bacterium]|nr:hypothetical protein [Elusimicrobiota bacterium]